MLVSVWSKFCLLLHRWMTTFQGFNNYNSNNNIEFCINICFFVLSTIEIGVGISIQAWIYLFQMWNVARLKQLLVRRLVLKAFEILSSYHPPARLTRAQLFQRGNTAFNSPCSPDFEAAVELFILRDHNHGRIRKWIRNTRVACIVLRRWSALNIPSLLSPEEVYCFSLEAYEENLPMEAHP